MKNKNLHIRLPEELLNSFTKVTNEKAVNRSELIRRWIEEYIRVYKKGEGTNDQTV